MATRGAGKKRRFRWLVSHVLTPALYAGLATLLAASVQTVSTERLVSSLERDVLSWLLLHRRSRDPNPHLAVVAVDTPAFEQDGDAKERPLTPRGRKPLASYRPKGNARTGVVCECPVPRTCYATAVERLARWGARAVVLDVMFRASCPFEDRRLERAIQETGTVVVAVPTTTVPRSRSGDSFYTADALSRQPRFAAVAGVGSPVIQPRDQEYALELRQTTQDLDTGENREYDALAWAAVCLAENRMPDETSPWEPFMIDGTQPRLLNDFFSRSMPAVRTSAGGIAMPEVTLDVRAGKVQVDEVLFRKHLLINFSTGAQEDQGRYPLARLSWVLSCSDEEGRARFGGRIVLVGNPTEDRHKTLVGDMPGTEVLANAVSSILERKPLRAVPARWALLLMFLLSALAVILIRETPGLVAAGGVLALAAGQVALSLYLIERDWWLLTASPLVAMGTASLGILAWQNDRFQDAVARLAPRRIAALAERAGGFQVEEASVLFSDIRGYTTISETMDPAEVLTYLNRYMSSVDDVLKHHGGHFVSCPGDCVVAWFGGERHGPPHQERAIRCGLEILANVERFREEWQRETGLNFAVGVGINSGPMAVGMLQARRRMEATIIGDAVNTAARIESLTKEYGSFLVSEETLAPVRERFQAELVGDVPIKGRTQPVRLYRILALGADQKPSRSHRSLRSLQHLFLRPGSNDGGATSEGERL